jgi:hypothetical protein
LRTLVPRSSTVDLDVRAEAGAITTVTVTV